MESNSKPWFKSRTIWFNAISGIVGVVASLTNSPLASDPKIQAGAALFLTIGNAFLRFISDQPITIK